MRTATQLGSLLSLAAFACACSGGDEQTGEVQFELLTWWSQKSELDAIDAAIAVNDAKHPHVHIRVLTADSQGAMANDVQTRLATGTPPTAYQANLGGNALQWQDSALPLSSRAVAWRGAFNDSILERVSVAGDLIAVPLALTRQNNAYYNLSVLADAGLEIPEGRDELGAWLAALSDKGYTHPICMGDQHNWVSAHVLFEDIVPGYVGADFSQDFWSGKLDADDPALSDALDYAATLNPYYNTDFADLDWDKGLLRVMDRAKDPAEQCVVAPMGDWGGAVLADSYAYDKDFTQRSWPGAEKLFVLAGDAFMTTRGVKDEDAALDFFDTLASEEGQVAFNAKKGSVPARTLPQELRSSFGPLTRANLDDLAAGTALPAFKVLGSGSFPWDDLAKLTHDFMLVGDKAPLIAFIAKNYDKLSR
ncbi:MAG TPA: ABC transporter substrate-binding protein [Polyangiaceae bacterium]|nr:ABC transporter substrate-binding protein [Polyangiaceae bacterium]